MLKRALKSAMDEDGGMDETGSGAASGLAEVADCDARPAVLGGMYGLPRCALRSSLRVADVTSEGVRKVSWRICGPDAMEGAGAICGHD